MRKEQNYIPEYNPHPTIIGLHYKPTDNSWAINVKNGCDAFLTGKIFEIMSDPFVKQAVGSKSLHEFIRVKSHRTGNEYEVLFKESDIIED